MSEIDLISCRHICNIVIHCRSSPFNKLIPTSLCHWVEQLSLTMSSASKNRNWKKLRLANAPSAKPFSLSPTTSRTPTSGPQRELPTSSSWNLRPSAWFSSTSECFRSTFLWRKKEPRNIWSIRSTADPKTTMSCLLTWREKRKRRSHQHHRSSHKSRGHPRFKLAKTLLSELKIALIRIKKSFFI